IPGAPGTSAGRGIRLKVEVTVTAVTVPLKPPVADPPMLQAPALLVEWTVPGEALLSVCPAAIVVVPAGSAQTVSSLSVRATVIALGAATGAPLASSARATIWLDEVPLAAM